MTVKDRLQIILITYNRSQCVKEIFEQFFFEGSPVADCDFLVLDNNSTDNTQIVVEEFAKNHTNIIYSKNRYNLGLSGNIAKAMESANKDYVWIIGDDDIFDFSNWAEVEHAIDNNEEIICVSRYGIPEGYEKNIPFIVGQLTFISGGIYKTSIFNNTTIKNAFDNIYTLFPHITPIVQHINDGKIFYVVKKAIADNGIFVHSKDNSFTRGFKDLDNVYNRTKTMHWVVGYANICSQIKDSALREAVFMHGLHGISGPDDAALKSFCNMYHTDDLLMQFIDIYMYTEPKLKRKMKKFILQHYFNQGLFSIYIINKTTYLKLFNGLFTIKLKRNFFNIKILIKTIYYYLKLRY